MTELTELTFLLKHLKTQRRILVINLGQLWHKPLCVGLVILSNVCFFANKYISMQSTSSLLVIDDHK